MTQPAATSPDPAAATFYSVAHPQRTGKYACGSLARKSDAAARPGNVSWRLGHESSGL